MAVYHRLNLRPCLVQPAMDKSLEISFSRRQIDGRAVEGKFLDVARFHKLGRLRARKQKAFWFLRVSRAHMAKRIDNFLRRQYPVGGDQILDHMVVVGQLLFVRRTFRRLLREWRRKPPALRFVPREYAMFAGTAANASFDFVMFLKEEKISKLSSHRISALRRGNSKPPPTGRGFRIV